MAAIQPQPPLGAPVAGLSLAEALEMRAKAGKPVRVGLIGAGQMGTDIVVQISQMTGIEIAAVADIAPDRVSEAASLAGRKGGPQTNAYSASKHAANSMTDAMRQELGDRNIRVSYLMPGATKSEVGDSITDPNWRKAIQAHVGKEGAVLPEEIGQTIVFMLSLPRRVNISEITVRPTIDTTA